MPVDKRPCVFFTIVARNYIAYARTLCQSIARSHPGAKIYIGLSDRLEAGAEMAGEDFEIVTVEQLDLPSPARFAFRYDVMEFSTAIKPYLFRWLFRTTGADRVIYLDPDILVLSPLTEVLDRLEQGATAVLTPHFTERVDDGFHPDEVMMLRVGAYNLGFIAVARGEEGGRLVDWWCDRLERGAVVDLENGLFTDQKWADLMPCLFAGVAVLRKPGYNVAYWNLMHQQVTRADGVWQANGEALAFFHFSGVDPRNPGIFSKHQNRYSLKDVGELAELYGRYLGLLKGNGYADAIKIAYGYGRLADGTRIHPAMRTYFRRFLDTGPDRQEQPFTGLDLAYFNELEPSLSGNDSITRFMYGLYLHQKELRGAFDLEDGQRRRIYANWFVQMAPAVYGVDEGLVAAARARADHPGTGLAARPVGSLSDYLKRWLSRRAYQAHRWNPGLALALARMLPPALIETLRSHALHSGPIELTGDPVAAGVGGDGTADRPGVTVIGYARGEFGIAENLRAVAGALAEAEYPFDVFGIDTAGVYNEADSTLSHLDLEASANAIQLYCVNADQMSRAGELLGTRRMRGRYRIGYWFWELSRFPRDWHGAFDLVDEVWAPSRYIQDALSRVSSKPVVHMPVAVDFVIRGEYGRAGFGLPEDPFLFLFSYDFHSFSQRKNPDAVVAAFQRAFPGDESGVGLVIKTVYGDKHPELYSKLLELARADARIRVIDRVMPRDEMYGLIDACDCYVSLHRAEGFGLGLAEAMCLGKPVIGTGYSGNMDFMTADNSCLVDYRLVPVPPDAYPYWHGQEWAEPDVGQAADYMRRLYGDAGYRMGIALRGQASIRRNHSYASVGRRMRERLLELP